MNQYGLPEHIHFCWRGNSVVVLDLRQDEYTLLSRSEARLLRTLCAEKAATAEIQSPDMQPLSELLTAGILSGPELLARPVAPTTIDIPLEAALENPVPGKVRVRMSDALRVFAACVRAGLQLRFMHLERIIYGFAGQSPPARPIDPDRLRHLVAVFMRLRPLYPRDYLCLFDSLALMNYLSSYGLRAMWVFAITLEPWNAHCWVQTEHYLLNEGVEEAGSYTPIFSV